MHYTVYEWVKKGFTVDLVTKLALHITSKNKMKLRGDEDSLDETDLYYSFWSMIADFNEIKIALDWSSSEILDILDYTNSIILSSLHVALAPVIQRSEGWKDRAVICNSPICAAASSCILMSAPVMQSSYVTCHLSVTLEWAHVICMVQSNIDSAQYYSHQYLPPLSGSINTYTERKQ